MKKSSSEMYQYELADLVQLVIKGNIGENLWFGYND